MGNMFLNLLKPLVPILWGLLYAVLACVAAFIASMVFNILANFKLWKKREKSHYQKWKEPPLFIKFFWLLPKRIILDIIERPADFFPVSGVVIFEGSQGSGKTSSMVHEIRKLQHIYPLVQTTTNFDYINQNVPLDRWQQLIDFNNGYQGVISAIDELQNWFSSKASKDFPPEMLSVVTQNRKNRRVIFGTAQNFYMLAKDIRTQCTEIRRCFTLFGALTIVHRVKPICDSAGNVETYKHIGFYCWVHSKQDRDSYDTYKTIENLRKSGFVEKINRFTA